MLLGLHTPAIGWPLVGHSTIQESAHAASRAAAQIDGQPSGQQMLLGGDGPAMDGAHHRSSVSSYSWQGCCAYAAVVLCLL